MINIRTIFPSDAAVITDLSQQLGYGISEEQTLKNINAFLASNDHEVFVAEDEGKVIGWMGMSYYFSLESLPLCEIHGLVVDENYRGKGIGKLFIEKAKEWTLQKGVMKLRLRCNVKRTDAHRFYENAGFTEIKQQKVYEMILDK